MQYEKIFKNILLIYFFIFALSLIPTVILGDFFTPNPEYVFVSEEAPFFIEIIPNSFETILVLFFFLVLIVYFYSLYLLFTFKKFGKKLFIYCFIIIMILSLISYGTYYTGVEEFLALLSYVFEGIIIAFLYFTPIKEKFN
tara:strand:- start:944 stop:1366 length:423 start_codon:yes stop_codon:yes gene_type:complete